MSTSKELYRQIVEYIRNTPDLSLVEPDDTLEGLLNDYHVFYQEELEDLILQAPRRVRF